MMVESILEIFFRTVNDCSKTKGLFGSRSLAGDVRGVVFCWYLRLRLTFSLQASGFCCNNQRL